ncbi:mycothiol synthase [Saccharothrix coeruleofusca]|uniref:Mycothiol acetyltransferase n=1 Tax=Saccharothrix coeruleofusca TaxID=33919 RepID=A0A918EEH1_9PSEU|nr:mycothiol synthase [Saccharothrix coeruleofusca]MBP2339631.1 mycothiol synthase [Saccharothrix coeruleofusca]GGP56428.1 mycothiol acetyltransferase [Saccharothrix coeruleofusca]
MDLTWYDELTDERAGAVSDLLAEAERADGVAPVGEAVRLRMRPGARGSAHLLARSDDGALVGYAHVDLHGDADGNKVAELAVHPAHRRRGVGTALARAVAERAEPLRVWAHGDQVAARELAAALGFRKVRELRRMRMSLEAELPAPRLPDGVRLRAFEPGRDEAAVVHVNHRAFSWHPEQGAMSVEDLQRKQEEPWFDAKGFLLAVDAEDRLLGFHWTKAHDQRLGEVYVVGVDPDAQGGGLGRALTLAGLAHLRDSGLREVMLYVESDNAPAVRVYTKLGFTVWDADVQYAQ